jgi:hypothetical protein
MVMMTPFASVLIADSAEPARAGGNSEHDAIPVNLPATGVDQGHWNDTASLCFAAPK